MDNGTIGIMVGSNSLRKLVLRKYMDCNTTRMKLFSFTSFAIDWDRKKIKGLQLLNHKWVESTFSFPKVVYNRCYNVDVGVVKQLENVIGINKCFNHINQLNKLETYTHLSRWLNPHLPETVPYDKGEAARLLDVHKLLYVKPCYGQMGKGVYRVEKKTSGEIHISSHHFLPEIIAENIVQFGRKSNG